MTKEWWTEPGWAWKTHARAIAPRYWNNNGGQPLVRRFGEWQALKTNLPTMHVKAQETQAYCRSIGRPLPSEAG